jgi:hypothetical protein
MVGDVGTVLHWNGATWSSVNAGFAATTDLTSVHGSSASDVWIGGIARSAGATLRRWNGTSWSDAQYAGNVTDVWVHTATDVWATGGATPHFNGSTWIAPSGGGPFITPSGLVRVMGSRLDSNVLFTVPPDKTAWGGPTLSEGPVVALGADIKPSATLAFDSDFVLSTGSCFPGDTSCNSVDRLVTLTHLDRSSGSFVSYGTGLGGAPQLGAHALTPLASDDDVLLFGAAGLFRGEVGGTMAYQTGVCADQSGSLGYTTCGPNSLNPETSLVAASSANDIWFAQGTQSAHWNGSAWTSWTLPAAARTLLVSAAHAYVLDVQGHVSEFGTSGWSAMSGAPVLSVLVAGFGDELWGQSGSDLQHFAAGSWSVVPGGSLTPALCTEAPSTNQLRLVTRDEVATFNGAAWTHAPGPGGSSTTCAIRANRAWAAERDKLRYFDGSAWVEYPNYESGERALEVNTVPRLVAGPGGRTWASYEPPGAVLEWRPR